MDAAGAVIFLGVLGAVFIIGFAWLMGLLTPRKQPEAHCPFCKRVVQNGSTVCQWCGKEIPAED